MGGLEKITKSEDASLETEATIMHSLTFPITMYGKKADGGENDAFETGCWRRGSVDPLDLLKDEHVGPGAN